MTIPTEEEMYSSKGRDLEDQAAQLARSRKDGPTDSLACLSSSKCFMYVGIGVYVDRWSH